MLLYHGFGSRSAARDPHNLFVPIESVRKQLRRLLDSGRRALSLDEYLSGLANRSWPERAFLVTIDDGYISTLEQAAPMLAAEGIPAVLFIPSGRIGGTSDWMPTMPHERLLTSSELQQLSAYGVDIGSHGVDHVDLRGLSPAEVERQVVGSADRIAEITGHRPRVFSYPFGWYDDAAVAAVSRAGYEAAFAIKAPFDRLTVPRVDVNAVDTIRTFAMKTSSWWITAQAVADRLPRLRRVVHHAVGMERRPVDTV